MSPDNAAWPDYRAVSIACPPREIRRAVQNLVSLDTNQVAAVDARMELDLRFGAIFTRFQSLSFRKSLPEVEGKVISYGKIDVKSAVVSLTLIQCLRAMSISNAWFCRRAVLESQKIQVGAVLVHKGPGQ